jgi:signal transduction histidine kinase
VSLTLRTLATRLGRGVSIGANDLDEAISLVNKSIESTRAMAHGMSPVTLDKGGISAALNTLAERSRVAYGISVRARTRNSTGREIGQTLAYHLYRITQEAVSNAVKHGGCRVVSIDLGITKRGVTLTVDDDGSGIPEEVARVDGMGLKTMTYRARLVGGIVSVSPRPGGGTRVRCVCPDEPPKPRQLTARSTVRRLPKG